MDHLDRELSAALDVEPSVEFRARVHERMARESMASRWQLPLTVLAVAAAIVVAVVATVLIPRAPVAVSERTAMVPPPIVDALVLRPVPLSAARGAETARPVAVTHRPAGHASLPEVLIPPEDREGLRMLFAGAASGALTLPPDMLEDTTVPLARFGSTTSEGDVQ